MAYSLEKLLEKKLTKDAASSKKTYFRRNQKLIFQLLDAGATYAEVLGAFEEDGVKMSLRYFTQLVGAERPKAGAIAVSGGRPTGPPIAEKSATSAATKEGWSPEKVAYAAELERIKSLNINSKERRAMMMKAAEDFSKTQNPLDRK